MDGLFDELEAARGSSASLSAEIATKQDIATLPAAVFGQGTNIESVDLDDYKADKIGRYYTKDGTQSATITNCPYKNAGGSLTVEAIADTANVEVGFIIQQTWKTNSSDAQTQTYIRKYRGDQVGWSAWMRIPCAFDDYLMSTQSLGASGSAYASIDLDTLKAPGVYRCTGSNSSNVSNKPTANNVAFVLTVRGTYNTSSFRQELMPADANNCDKIYVRNCVAGTWTSWYVFSGTVVS
jgi:hypothetical protein